MEIHQFMIKKINQLQTNKKYKCYKGTFFKSFFDKRITAILTMNDHQLEHEKTLDEVTKIIMNSITIDLKDMIK